MCLFLKDDFIVHYLGYFRRTPFFSNQKNQSLFSLIKEIPIRSVFVACIMFFSAFMV